MTLHELLDDQFGADGDAVLRRMLNDGADPDARAGACAETPLHVATRRRRGSAVQMLLSCGADIDATTSGGKTACAHAARRRFDDIVEVLVAHGAATALNKADQLAVAVVEGRLDAARAMIAVAPELVRTGNPEEDRLLADVAGRPAREPVKLLIDAGADLAAPGLDGGTPLHQAAWFGEPVNVRLLIDAGAPLDVFEATHGSSPLGWAVHGSAYSGGARERQAHYIELATMLLEAGSSLHYPRDTSGAYLQRLLQDGSPEVAKLVRRASSA